VEILLTNRPEERPRLLAALEAFGREQRLPANVLQAADLALEEHLTNIMRYAYEDERPREILIRLLVEQKSLLIEVVDNGKPFNPLSMPPVDTSVPLNSKPVGGLGIHLIRHFMDEVEYSRNADRNILRMRKGVESGSP
jgi:anti-sigma regulatory factor (Ser/Thr protein kinase)